MACIALKRGHQIVPISGLDKSLCIFQPLKTFVIFPFGLSHWESIVHERDVAAPAPHVPAGHPMLSLAGKICTKETSLIQELPGAT